MQTEHNTSKISGTSIVQSSFRILLGFFLAYAGFGHLTFLRVEFSAQVPKWVFFNEDLVVIFSGILEIFLGLSLIFLKRSRTTVGWIVAVFFVLVFPGNISQYAHHIDAFGLDSDKKRFIRLLFQPVLIAWVLWSTGAWAAWRRKRH